MAMNINPPALSEEIPGEQANKEAPEASAGAATRSRRALAIIASLFRSCWRIITVNPKMITGSIIVGIFILLAIFGPLLARYDPNRITYDILQAPSATHWLGTTQIGQDVFSQLMHGTRFSVFWGILTGLAVMVISIVIGLAGGYFGGVIDDTLTLITNIFLVIPGLPLALVMAAYIPSKGPLTVAIVIMITSWAGPARLLRSQTLTMRKRDFVEAARSSGMRTWRIIFLEILPNMMALVAASLVGTIIGAILTAAALEFLGLGDVASIDWGTMLYWAQQGSALLQGAWWWFVPPGVCIMLLGGGLTFINLGIDEFADPRLRNETKRFKRRQKQRVTLVEQASVQAE